MRVNMASFNKAKPSILFLAFPVTININTGVFNAHNNANWQAFINVIVKKPLYRSNNKADKNPKISIKAKRVTKKPDNETGVILMAENNCKSFSSNNMNDTIKPGRTALNNAKILIISL